MLKADIAGGILDLHRLAYAISVVVDILAPNDHQGISNHYADPTATAV